MTTISLQQGLHQSLRQIMLIAIDGNPWYRAHQPGDRNRQNPASSLVLLDDRGSPLGYPRSQVAVPEKEEQSGPNSSAEAQNILARRSWSLGARRSWSSGARLFIMGSENERKSFTGGLFEWRSSTGATGENTSPTGRLNERLGVSRSSPISNRAASGILIKTTQNLSYRFEKPQKPRRGRRCGIWFTIVPLAVGFTSFQSQLAFGCIKYPFI